MEKKDVVLMERVREILKKPSRIIGTDSRILV